jgi:hypothetical protein
MADQKAELPPGDFTYTIVIGGTVATYEELVDLVSQWELHPGATIIGATMSKSPPLGTIPYTVPPDGHARLGDVPRDEGKS